MRKSVCLRAFKNYNVKKEPIVTKYFNKYYQKDLDLKICDFYWACSRKSYLPCGQTYDIFSYDVIIDCLKAGARFINLDIYSDEKNDPSPIVRNKTMMAVYGKPLDFEKCLKIIDRYAWIDAPDYPLILYLTINTNDRLIYVKMAAILKRVFNGKFINKKYSFNGRNNLYPFGQIPIKETLGYLAILTDKYPTAGVLDEYINGVITEQQQFIKPHIYSKVDENYGGIVVKNSDTGSMIDFNKTNITMVYSEGEDSIANIHNPKSDLYNPPPLDCWKYGCQLVLMNYQLYDKNMKTYVDKFKERGVVLKPENLRFIPKPKPKIKTQNKNAYYQSRTITQPGWYSVNV